MNIEYIIFLVHRHISPNNTMQITQLPHQPPAPPFDAFTHIHEVIS